MTQPHILALDQGTTSSRALIFDAALTHKATAQREFAQHFPHPGWVEHDPAEIWDTTLATAREAIARAALAPGDIAAIGITNQRETTLLWDRATGQPLHRAIVWQDRRTAATCDRLREAGHEPMVTARTGLLLDPYFSGTKLAWLLDTIPGARQRAAAGELAFGTVDSWLIWNLTGGKAHVTDATNAARTLLFDIHSQDWSPQMLELLDIPAALLPRVLDCADAFGTCDPALFGAAIPITGVAGDQQAATMGQACFQPGMMKSTYGTGCFALMNTGATPVVSQNRLLTTVAYRLQGQPTYALEGAIFTAGAVVQWLRDGLGIIGAASQTQPLAERSDLEQNLIMVPAFTGLGAPHWAPQARGAVFGLTRNSGPAEFARAALESVGFQTRDLVQAMQGDLSQVPQTHLRVDGGMANSDWAMQFLADILGAEALRPALTETTALGAAWLAGWQAGLCGGPEAFAANWSCARRFAPQMPRPDAERRYEGWTRAVQAVLAMA